ncbi:MAG: PLP-dependent aminotransferase family protein [Alphaproteobacteria bacterium]|jgi:2-aminoadipate transaminase|nr:aminotransferase [Rhodospirillaceae bacterium]MDP6407129.1 PLP-dependent aminotransferase family protein [Alphaproteobacteria bacterium]MDP6623790.1 PLP-dependent aminotransferase family protein [Alphaproteobacteria bacterium]
MNFDFSVFLRSDLPPPAQRWSAFPEYNFVGGHNDATGVPAADLAAAAQKVLSREGSTLATYWLESGPQGYRPLREFVAAKLEARAGLACSPDEVLITSGSLQALDLVNALLLEPGDVVIVEAATYGGALTRLGKLGVDYVGVDLDQDGMRPDALAVVLGDLAAAGRKPKFIYTIPTVQNPTGTVMSHQRRLALLELAREHGVPVFEDDCYADLLWERQRPAAIRALDDAGQVIYCGSFSKSIAPALRVGYVVADWPVLSRLLPLKTDGGTGALEQMVLAEYASGKFDGHVTALQQTLRDKCQTMMAALEEQFGATAEFEAPSGGIFIWITLPEGVDTGKLAQAALAEGVALNPGSEWMADAEAGRNRLRLCFANPSKETIQKGVARLAEICHRETGIPVRSANVSRDA